jgi:Lar family restriction alleviation protein
MSDLKPCPCCGYRAQIEQVPHEPETVNSGGYYIECKRAGCGITTRLAFSVKEDARPTLIAAWNRRVTEETRR